MLLVSVHVLVAAAGEIENHEVVLLELREPFDKAGDGMCGFERGNNALGAREQAGGIESGLIGNRGVFGAALIGKPGVLGTDGGIVEACGNGVRGCDLPILVLQNVSVGPLQHTGPSATETLVRSQPRRVLAEPGAAAAGFDTNHFHARVAQKLMKEADGIRAAANAGEKMRGQALLRSKYLLARFAANHRLKI